MVDRRTWCTLLGRTQKNDEGYERLAIGLRTVDLLHTLS
jgi:hypothetical protein